MGVAFMPILGVTMMCVWFSKEPTVTAKIICSSLGLILTSYSIYTFLFDRYEICVLDNHIRIEFTYGKQRSLNMSFNELSKIKITDAIRGGKKCHFKFLDNKKKFFVEITQKEDLIPLIIHAKRNNPKILCEALPIGGTLHQYIKKELKKNALQQRV